MKETNASESDKLMEGFASATPESWREAVESLLKGAPFEKAMKTATLEGLTLDPIYFQDALVDLPMAETLPGTDGCLRGTKASGYRGRPWSIAQELPYGEPHEFNRALRQDLMRGQDALNVNFDLATLRGVDPDVAHFGEVGACGLSLASLEDISRAFDGVHPEAVSCHLRTGGSGLALGALFLAWLNGKAVDLSQLEGSLNMDPLAVLAASGQLPVALDRLLDEQAVLARHCAAIAPGLRSVGVSTMPYHQAGASAREELALALATGVAYLAALQDRGMGIEEAARQIRFSFTVGPDCFMEIAKFRAFRVLWSQVVGAFGGSSEAGAAVVHARTGLHNKTQKDPYVNLLRTTTEALSAVIGGVDSLCVGNFDETTRVPDAFARRISRNTQIILQEECELLPVIDPAGGSWAVESLTDELGKAAWGLFQEVEQAGGMVQALRSGWVGEVLAKTEGERRKRFHQRRISLVGTNVYPNLDEPALAPHIPDYAQVLDDRAREVISYRMEKTEDQDASVMEALNDVLESPLEDVLPLMVKAFEAGATLGEVTRALWAEVDAEPSIPPLPASRLAASYERLREASHRYQAEHGHRPQILLCNLGPLRSHKIRADFTRSFFQAGGFELLDTPGFAGDSEAIAAVRQSNAPVVVVCGKDEDYAERFAGLARGIKSACPKIKLVLAGHPGDHLEAFREAGLDDFIFAKSAHYEVNAAYLRELGVI